MSTRYKKRQSVKKYKKGGKRNKSRKSRKSIRGGRDPEEIEMTTFTQGTQAKEARLPEPKKSTLGKFFKMRQKYNPHTTITSIIPPFLRNK